TSLKESSHGTATRVAGSASGTGLDGVPAGGGLDTGGGCERAGRLAPLGAGRRRLLQRHAPQPRATGRGPPQPGLGPAQVPAGGANGAATLAGPAGPARAAGRAVSGDLPEAGEPAARRSARRHVLGGSL